MKSAYFVILRLNNQVIVFYDITTISRTILFFILKKNNLYHVNVVKCDLRLMPQLQGALLRHSADHFHFHTLY